MRGHTLVEGGKTLGEREVMGGKALGEGVNGR